MDSSPVGSCSKEKELSAEGAETALSPNSVDFYTGSKKSTSLDKPKKKVGQLGASRCKKSQTLYFVCRHGHVVSRNIRCHRRFIRECPYCGRLWRKITVKRYKKIVSRMQSPKHVVLTLRKGGKHKLEDLSKLVQRCRKYIRRLGYKLRSFVFCIEPPNHVHAVWDCDYIPQQGLVNIWKTVTGDSFVVYIRHVDRQRWRGAVKYIAKYITKISGSGSGMDRMHLIGCWGDEKGKRVRMVCKRCGSYFEPLWDVDFSVDSYVGCDFKEVDYG